MPIYEYRCEQGHNFEVLQRMSDDPLTSCTTCDAKVQRVLHPVAVHFKGSGFYTTDYARKGRAGGDAEARRNGSESGSSKESGSSSKEGDAKAGKAKSEASSSGSKSSGSD